MFVLCKSSKGGFNDMLCQIYNCYKYCSIHKRVLLLDTSASSYAFSFDKYFYFKPSRRVRVITNTNLIRKIVKRYHNSVYPNEMRHRLLNYEIECVRGRGVIDSKTKTQLKFNLKKKYAEAILLYDAYGGGSQSFYIFSLLRFKSHLKKVFFKRYSSLKKPYICVYVRNTDIQTDYRKLYEDNKDKLHRIGSIYVATDSTETLDFFKNLGLRVTNFSTINNSKCNLHEADIPADTKNKRHGMRLTIYGIIQPFNNKFRWWIC